jgi:hypothetical protein
MNWAPARKLAAVATAAAAILTLTAASNAATITAGPACGMAQRTTQQATGGIWTISRPNPFGLPSAQAAKFCIRPAGDGFTITRNVPYDGAVRAFPFTGVGCAYDLCSRNTGLPLKVRDLPGNANVSWDWRGSSPGYYDATLDYWFSKTDQITAQDNGAEIMIWTHTPPDYRQDHPDTRFWYVKIGKHWYWYTAWRSHHGPISWWYIQFETPRTVHGVHQLWMKPFIRYAQARGLLKPSWWLTSVHAGYELWSGGKGLSTSWFNAHT